MSRNALLTKNGAPEAHGRPGHNCSEYDTPRTLIFARKDTSNGSKSEKIELNFFE
jgi:hypothetical protein